MNLYIEIIFIHPVYFLNSSKIHSILFLFVFSLSSKYENSPFRFQHTPTLFPCFIPTTLFLQPTFYQNRIRGSLTKCFIFLKIFKIITS
eukprot:UN20103